MFSKASEIQAELSQILESRWLRESTQLRNFLRYVVEETLEGRMDGLKEYSLGREVFHRPPDYDPRSDAIVRVQASLLRKRISSYYDNEGRDSTIRIELPRGGYQPVFRDATQVSREEVSPVEIPKLPARRSLLWMGFAVGILVGIILAWVGAGLLRRGDAATPTPGPALWGSLLHPGEEVIVSYGVPQFYGSSGVFIRDIHVNAPGTESRGKLSSIQQVLSEPIRMQEDVYTGIGEMMGTHHIAHWLEARGVRVRVANSHYLGPSEISGKNLVVVSSSRFQTLLSEMNLPNRFRFDGSSIEGAFVLDHPLSGEQAIYHSSNGAGVATSYAVLSLWPGHPVDKRILYLTGISTWATQGAAQFAVDVGSLSRLQARLDADPPEGPRGKKGPFFQVLLRVEGKYNQVRAAEYVTHRYVEATPHPE